MSLFVPFVHARLFRVYFIFIDGLVAAQSKTGPGTVVESWAWFCAMVDGARGELAKASASGDIVVAAMKVLANTTKAKKTAAEQLPYVSPLFPLLSFSLFCECVKTKSVRDRLASSLVRWRLAPSSTLQR